MRFHIETLEELILALGAEKSTVAAALTKDLSMKAKSFCQGELHAYDNAIFYIKEHIKTLEEAKQKNGS
jgi:hypothetical protein